MSESACAAGQPPAPRAAATVVVLRDGDDGVQVLLMGRHGGSPFMPGMTVFPGGKVDPQDCVGDEGEEQQARRGAIRELREETALDLENDAALPCFAHWLTPEAEARRFDTLFFAARAPLGQVPVGDAKETTTVQWWLLDRALAANGSEILLPPPTLHTLERLLAIGGDVAHLLTRLDSEGRGPCIMPHVVYSGATGPGAKPRCIAMPWDPLAPNAELFVAQHGQALAAMTAVAVALPTGPAKDRFMLTAQGFVREF